MTFARLSAVYGLSYTDINAMPLAAIRAYLDCIPAVQAEQRLIVGDGASLPYMKDPRKVQREWQKAAYDGLREARPATPAILKMMGIGVEYAS